MRALPAWAVEEMMKCQNIIILPSRTVQARRHGGSGLHPHILPQWDSALAGAPGQDQGSEIRENQREETLHIGGGALQRRSR